MRGQLSLAIPEWVGTMSPSESWDVRKHTPRCTSPIRWSCSVNWCLAEGQWNGDQRRPYGPCGSGRTLRNFYNDNILHWEPVRILVLSTRQRNNNKKTPNQKFNYIRRQIILPHITEDLWWWHTVKKLVQETCTSFLRKFLASNFRASSCKFGWRHIKQESPANAKVTCDSSACMKAQCEQI